MKQKIALVNTDGKNIGEYIITDGAKHMLYSPYGNQEITNSQFKNILKQHKAVK